MSRRALVTGSARGIGRAIAEALHRDGMEVIGADVLDQDSTGLYQVIQADLADPDGGHRIFEEAGDVDVLVNNAALFIHKPIEEFTPEDAPITIVEFSDFQCPYCKRVVPTLHQIVEKYPDQVRIVFRHLPLDRIHGRARPAAEASAKALAEAKALSDKYGQLSDLKYGTPAWVAVAKELV